MEHIDRTEEQRLREMTNVELVRHALQEAKLLARAELLHAKAELRDEVKAAKKTGILAGTGAVLGIAAIAVLLVAVGLALPLGDALGVLVVGAVVLVIAAVLAYAGYRKMPRQPLPRTQERLKDDVRFTRERFA